MERRHEGRTNKDLRERDGRQTALWLTSWQTALWLADGHMADSAIQSGIGKDLAARASGLGLTAREFDDLGPRAELGRIAENAGATRQLDTS